MLEPQDVLVLTGGDGTINRFLNEADYDAFENEIYITQPEAATTSCTIWTKRLTPRRFRCGHI